MVTSLAISDSESGECLTRRTRCLVPSRGRTCTALCLLASVYTAVGVEQTTATALYTKSEDVAPRPSVYTAARRAAFGLVEGIYTDFGACDKADHPHGAARRLLGAAHGHPPPDGARLPRRDTGHVPSVTPVYGCHVFLVEIQVTSPQSHLYTDVTSFSSRYRYM